MFKRITSLIILLIMAFSIASTGMVCLAGSDDLVETDLVMNGDMEWLGTSYVCWSGTHAPETEIVHGGEKSMKLTVNASRTIYPQSGSGIVSGQTYTLSYWIYAEKSFEQTYVLNGALQEAGAGTKIEIAGKRVDASGNETSTTIVSASDTYNPTEDELGTWIQRTIT
ncbi:MAG: hypothetical protein IKB55_06410, partial [Clostridia bacterium]|nr:hypothetical protein [Clostridia bacterium]